MLAVAVLSLAGAGAVRAVIGDPAGQRDAESPAKLAGTPAGVRTLSVGTLAAISARIGATEAPYRVTPGKGIAVASSGALALRFTSDGASVSSGATRLRLSLSAAGDGDTLSAVGKAAPSVRGNRVTYGRPQLSEQYVNGPLGLEQDFTIPRPLPGRSGDELTLALSLGESAHARLLDAGRAVELGSGSRSSRLLYSGLYATDARGRRLSSSLALLAGRVLVRVDAHGAKYPLQIDPFIQQGAALEGEGSGSSFGAKVALSADGDTALISGPGQGSGAGVWVFVRSASGWVQQGPKLVGSEQQGTSEFGSAVALSSDGDTALIGGFDDDGGVGAAWVFTRSGSTWSQQGPKLTGAGEVGTGWFGISVALSGDGNTALIGGTRDTGERGAAWVFARSGSTWTQQGEKLVGSGICGTPLIGNSVALSADGNTAIVAGSFDCDVGAAWVYTRSGSTWTQDGPKLKATGEVGKGFFASSVALSADGQTALFGAYADDHGTGAAWVFAKTTSGWSQQGRKLTGRGELGPGAFGTSVALSEDGQTALIGGASENTGEDGSAWAFTDAGGSWKPLGSRLSGSAESSEPLQRLGGGGFGTTVALSGDGQSALIGGGKGLGRAGQVWSFAQAQTSQPDSAEFGRCVAVKVVGSPRFFGRYTNAGCTAQSRDGAYEWFSGVLKTHFTISGARVLLASRSGLKVTCARAEGSGSYSGATLSTMSGLTLSFDGCAQGASSCSSSPSAPGRIDSEQLEGQLGTISRAGGRTGGKLGLELFSPAGTFATFACGASPVSLSGTAIARLSANEMTSHFELAFQGLHGRRPSLRLEGQRPATLQASIDGKRPEAVGLRLRAQLSSEEALEALPARAGT